MAIAGDSSANEKVAHNGVYMSAMRCVFWLLSRPGGKSRGIHAYIHIIPCNQIRQSGPRLSTHAVGQSLRLKLSTLLRILLPVVSSSEL